MKQEGNYQVVLLGIEGTPVEKKESFCRKIAENYSISLPLLEKIVEHCPIVLKKNLSLDRAERLGKTLHSFGAIVSVEEKKEVPPILLEFKGLAPHRVALESTSSLLQIPLSSTAIPKRSHLTFSCQTK